MTRMVMTWSVKQLDSVAEYARTVIVALSDKAPDGVKVATVDEAPCVNPLTKNSKKLAPVVPLASKTTVSPSHIVSLA